MKLCSRPGTFRSLENRVLLAAKEVVENRSLLSFGTTSWNRSLLVKSMTLRITKVSLESFSITLFCKFYSNQIILLIPVKKLDSH